MLLLPFQQEWTHDFRRVKQILERGLHGFDIEIEHVGSTSIEALASKPIIDIDIVYHVTGSFMRISQALENLGYYHNGDQGIEGREVFKRSKQNINHPILDSIQHHLYVCHANSQELSNHLLFRDYLRNNETERKQYEALKVRIARKANQNKKVYAKLKETMVSEFVELIIKKAMSS